MTYTLGEAAKATGKSKTTIQRAIKSGKITALKGDSGAYNIDPSELHRVYPVTGTGIAKGNAAQPHVEHHSNEANVLAVKVEMLEQQLQREQETTDDLRKRLDKAEDRVIALTDQREVTTEQRSKGWLARLMG
jgi:excisionase family DNA binding protein